MEKNKFLTLKPMLLKEVKDAFSDPNYLYEIKFDGIRALIFIHNGEIIIKSRKGIILNDYYPELISIKDISLDTCIFDGEIVLIDENKISFSKLQERMRLKNKYHIMKMQEEYPVTFVCFDILYKDKNLTNLPLIERKKILDKFNDTSYFVKSKYFIEKGIEFFNIINQNNLEGMVAKKCNSIYTYNSRSSNWLKIKNESVEDFYVCGYELIKDKAVISVILGEKRNKEIYYVGKVIMGNKNSLYKKIKEEKSVNNYLINYDNEKGIIIKNKYKLTISYLERTKSNVLRQPHIKK